MKAIMNAKIVTEHEVLSSHSVVYDETIVAVIPDVELDSFQVDERVDAQGAYLLPGLIDVHIHGCSGADTMDEEPEALNVISRNLPRTGVTGFLPTTMTRPFEEVEKALERIRDRMGKPDGARVLGSHMEGPFISREYKGAHVDKHIAGLDFSKIESFRDVIRIVTIAPELDGSLEFIRQATEAGIVVSIGHSAATYDRAMEAIEAGASHVTHTFNALAGMNHRQPGVIGALADSDVTCELITDNVHVHPAAQRLLLKLKGPDRMILITDAMRAGLLPEGEYELGGQKVIVRNGEVRLENGVLAGSVLTLNRAIINFWRTSGLSLPEVVRMASLNPARKLGLEASRGSVAVGKDADLTLMDESGEILLTIVGGESVYRR